MRRYRFIFSFIAMLLVLLGFSGCAPTYSIEPVYNEATKELTIDALKFKNVRKAFDANPIHMGPGNFHHHNASYYVDTKKCKKIFYSYMDAGQNSYITNNLKDTVESSARQGKLRNCKVTEISNLVFYTCNNGNFNMVGMSFAGLNGGYSLVSKLLLDYACFNTIKNYFIKKAKKDKIEIKEYNLKNSPIDKNINISIKINKKQNIYRGGKVVFTVNKGDVLEVLRQKPCLKNKNKVCWQVADKKTGKFGYVVSDEMYKFHEVINK